MKIHCLVACQQRHVATYSKANHLAGFRSCHKFTLAVAWMDQHVYLAQLGTCSYIKAFTFAFVWGDTVNASLAQCLFLWQYLIFRLRSVAVALRRYTHNEYMVRRINNSAQTESVLM